LGCGDGALTKTIIACGCNVLGVDGSPAFIDVARQQGVPADAMDGQALTFDSEFDAVFSNAALHWMKDIDAVIAGVHRSLKPCGRFVAEMGGHGNVAAIVNALSDGLRKRGIDCNMPGIDGYALARAIRDLEEGGVSRTHLIAMTAKGTRGTRQKCIDAGMDDYVTKSIGDAQMKEILMKWLNVEAVAAAHLPHIPQTMIDTSLPVDLSLLNECVGDDDEARAMAIDLFIEGAHECMVALSIAKNVREELAWKQAAHKFKGAAANFGADHLRQCCQNAEHNALAGPLEKNIMFEKIDQALVAVKRYLDK